MAGTVVRRALLKIVADDGDTQAKLDKITAKAEELGRLNPEIKVKIDAAAATAEMMVLRRALRDAGNESGITGGRFMALSNLLGGRGSGVAQSLDKAAFNAAAGLDSAGTAASTSLPAWGQLGIVLAPLAPLLFTFAANLGLVGIGFAGFAALAVPEISKVIQARSALTAAEQRYDLATTKAQRVAALKAETAATAGLTAGQKQLMGPLGEIGKMFGQLQKAIQPEVLSAFGSGLKIIKDVMPALRPLVIAAGQAIDGFLKNIDSWLKSPSGQKFIHWMAVEGPHALATFGRYAWDTAKDVGRVFDFMYNTGSTFVRHWLVFWHDMAKIVDGFRVGFTQMGHLIESAWDHTVGAVISTGARVTSWFQALPGRIMSFLAGLPGMLFTAGQNAIRGLISGLGSMLGALGSMASSIASKVAGFFGLSPAREGPLSGLGAPEIRGRHFTEAFAGGMISGLGSAHSAAARLATAATLAQAAGPAGGYGGYLGGGVLRLEVTGGQSVFDQFMGTWLRNWVRVQGGDPAMFQRKVKYA